VQRDRAGVEYPAGGVISHRGAVQHLTYRDVSAASAWLAGVFGFTEHYWYGPPGAPGGAQMYLTG
jgi:hypothetical protein